MSKNPPCDFCEQNCGNEYCYTNKKKPKMIYDPPSGWKYGFPKEVPEDIKDFKQWLIDSGYPEKDIDFAMKYGRSWYK